MSHLRAGITGYVSGTVQPPYVCHLAQPEHMDRPPLSKVAFLEATLVCSTFWASRISLSIVSLILEHAKKFSLSRRPYSTHGSPPQD